MQDDLAALGREPQPNADGFGLVQYFFGATPRHIFFSEYLLPRVSRRAKRRRDPTNLASVLYVTGPQVFTAAYKAYVRDRAAARDPPNPHARWDERVLPTCALGAWCFDCERHGFRPFLEHGFRGSWKGGAWNASMCPRPSALAR